MSLRMLAIVVVAMLVWMLTPPDEREFTTGERTSSAQIRDPQPAGAQPSESLPAIDQFETPVSSPVSTPQDASMPTTGLPTTDHTTQPSIQISPAIVDNKLDAGKEMDVKIAVRNTSAMPMGVRGSVSSLVPEQKFDPDFAKIYDASSWFALDTPDFLLNSEETRVITAHLKVPPDAEPGGHYATIYFQTYVPQPIDVTNATSLNARVGVVVFLTVRGNINEHAAIDPLKLSRMQFEAGPTNINLGVKNDGNVHFLPSGNIRIRNMFGQTVKEISVPLGYVLPGTTREHRLVWEHGLLIGPYRASASIVAGSQRTELQTGTEVIWLIPLIVVIPVTLLALLLLSFIGFVKHRKKRRHIRRLARSLVLPSLDGEHDNDASNANEQEKKGDDS